MHFTVRNYQPADFFALWRIDQSCFPPGIAYTRDELYWFIRRKTGFTLVAEGCEQKATSGSAAVVAQAGEERVAGEPGSILGFLVAEGERGQGHVITIDVRSEARGKRIGSALLTRAEEHLRLRSCRTVRLETAVDNVGALGFYKKHGYVVSKLVPRYYSNGLDALVLEKVLLSSSRSDTLPR